MIKIGIYILNLYELEVIDIFGVNLLTKFLMLAALSLCLRSSGTFRMFLICF